MDPITVMIADDDAPFRGLLASVLARHDETDVVGQATNRGQVMDMVDTLRPDVVLLGAGLSGGAVEILPQIHAKSPETKVLMLSEGSSETFIAEALQKGARGFLLKTAREADLVKAIQSVHAGEFWAGRKVIAQVLDGLLPRTSDAPPSSPAPARGGLTDRELEIIGWTVPGKPNQETPQSAAPSGEKTKTPQAR